MHLSMARPTYAQYLEEIFLDLISYGLNMLRHCSLIDQVTVLTFGISIGSGLSAQHKIKLAWSLSEILRCRLHKDL